MVPCSHRRSYKLNIESGQLEQTLYQYILSSHLKKTKNKNKKKKKKLASSTNVCMKVFASLTINIYLNINISKNDC